MSESDRPVCAASDSSPNLVRASEHLQVLPHGVEGVLQVLVEGSDVDCLRRPLEHQASRHELLEAELPVLAAVDDVEQVVSPRHADLERLEKRRHLRAAETAPELYHVMSPESSSSVLLNNLWPSRAVQSLCQHGLPHRSIDENTSDQIEKNEHREQAVHDKDGTHKGRDVLDHGRADLFPVNTTADSFVQGEAGRQRRTEESVQLRPMLRGCILGREAVRNELCEEDGKNVDQQGQQDHGPKEGWKRPDDQINYLLELADKTDDPQHAQYPQQPEDSQHPHSAHVAEHAVAAVSKARDGDFLDNLERHRHQVEVVPPLAELKELHAEGEDPHRQLHREEDAEHHVERAVGCRRRLPRGALVRLHANENGVQHKREASNDVKQRALHQHQRVPPQGGDLEALRHLREAAGACVDDLPRDRRPLANAAQAIESPRPHAPRRHQEDGCRA
eukprot:CAMPEP_0176218864 /NCGR_PEP_ID=MMETSP0121_2-20121125/18416_1 /TAXON_ID=160619 /ORGANISM="Kryptoperidinium foliaceum, Strain CCMP 1326" /LENGTH=447 /DNA_ID=CAMNT_0017558015 /DNA_START=305 /DNA_END=1647 /DNA_ORIENTATION=+